MVGSDQCGDIESCPIEPAGKQWKHGVVTDGRIAIQENDHRSFLPALGAAEEPAINDVVFLVVALVRRGKLEMQRSIKFNLRRVACGGDKVRAIEKFDRFFQFPSWLGRSSQKDGVCDLKN